MRDPGIKCRPKKETLQRLRCLQQSVALNSLTPSVYPSLLIPSPEPVERSSAGRPVLSLGAQECGPPCEGACGA